MLQARPCCREVSVFRLGVSAWTELLLFRGLVGLPRLEPGTAFHAKVTHAQYRPDSPRRCSKWVRSGTVGGAHRKKSSKLLSPERLMFHARRAFMVCDALSPARHESVRSQNGRSSG